MSPPSTGAAPPPVSRARAAWALALLLGLQPVTTDIGAVLAQNIEVLIVWRVLQGVAMAAAVVCARAMLRDLYEPHEGAQVMSIGLSGLGVIALVGPLAGGVVSQAFGWRAAFVLVALGGAAVLAFIAWGWPETLRHRNPRATALGPLLRTWGEIARNRTFVAWTLLVAFTYGALFTILAGSSFVYIDVLGLTPGQYGLVLVAGSGAYVLGTVVCRRWIVRWGTAGAVKRGAVFSFVAGTSMLLLALAGVKHPLAVLLPQCIFAFGHGIHQPCGQTGSVGPFPHAAGAASALAGFVLSVVAFGIGLWLGRSLDGTVLPFALSVCVWTVLTSTVAWTLVQRQARLASAGA